MISNPVPFKFLDSYTREDRDIFFGREREIEELYQKVFDSKILLLYGLSGTGKTSLINCGLANKFEDSDWLPVNIRRGRNIIDSLQNELYKVTLTPLKRDVSIIDTLQSIYLDQFKPIYLIFDQFEELFIFGDRKERDSFVQIIKDLVESEVQCRFIFSIREEYLASITEFESMIPDFLSNRLRIEKMTRQHAIQVIEGPCKAYDIQVEDGFAEALLEKLSPESNEVELTYLQVFLDKIFRTAQNDRGGLHFTLEMLHQVGDVSDLLGSFLEEQVRNMEDPETTLTILKAFVSVKGTKRQIIEEDIVEFTKTFGITVELTRLLEIVQKFVNLRILRDKDENDRYELRHDSLAAKIFEKITLVEKELLEIRQFIETAYENHIRRETWLEASELEYLRPYRSRLFLSRELENFVRSSIERLERKKKALRRVSAISIIGLLIVTVLIGNYYKRSMDKSKATDYAIESLIQNDQIPEIAFETAMAAYMIDSTNGLSKRALFLSFYSIMNENSRFDSVSGNWMLYDSLVYKIPCNSNVIEADFTSSGNLIYALLEENHVKIWNLEGDEILNLILPGGEAEFIQVSENERFAGVYLKDSTIILIDTSDPKDYLVFNTLLTSMLPRNLFDFSSDGTRFIYLDENNDVAIFDTEERKQAQNIINDTSIITSIAVSPDNELIATADAEGYVSIYRFYNKSGKYHAYKSFLAHFDTIWSISFSENSGYILTTSADSAVCVHRVTGWNTFDSDYAHWSYESRRHKFYDAEFRGKEKVIVATSFSGNIDSQESGFLSIPFYSNKSAYWNTNPNKYLGYSLGRFNNELEMGSELKEIEFYDHSKNGNYTAITRVGEEKTNLYSPGFVPVYTFTGINPRFSQSGKHLLCLDGKSINIYVSDELEMMRIIENTSVMTDKMEDLLNWFFRY